MIYSVAVVIVSDRIFRNESEDQSLDVFKATLPENKFKISEIKITSDDPDQIEKTLLDLIERKHDLILTTGGTGCSKRDNTPDVTRKLLKKPTPGVDEAIRQFSQTKTGYAIYSRAISGIAKDSFVINLPGSPKAVKEILEFLLGTIEHPLKLIKNEIKDCRDDLIK